MIEEKKKPQSLLSSSTCRRGLMPMDSFGIGGENQMKLYFFIESYFYSSV